MPRPLVLLTNDDGVHAPGLRALRRALSAVAEVYVVAPDREVSACAQALTIKNPLRAQPVDATTWAIDGTPADCVNLGVVKLLPRRPDLVVSGINRGANLGDDVFYSGTVAGAREALFFGLPAIAFSLAARAAHSFTHAAAFAARLVPRVLRDGLPPATLLNVNVPAGRPLGVRVTVQGRRDHHGTVLEGLDPRRRTYYWIEEGRDDWADDPQADIHAVRAGYVSITPLQTDTTAREALPLLKSLESPPKRRESPAKRPESAPKGQESPKRGEAVATRGESDARRAATATNRQESPARRRDTETSRQEAPVRNGRK